MQIAINYPALAYDGELTFAGMLRKYFIEYDDFGNNIGISKRWNDNTKSTYIRQYERQLIPKLAELYGKEKPIHSYSEDEYEEALKRLNQEHHYAEGTIEHYRYLLWVVYKAGFEHSHYADNIFWGDVIDLEDGNSAEKEELRAKVMTRTRRSFSIEEELSIVEWFQGLDPETARGEDIGLMFMFFQGLRNNEACGANLGSVHILQGSQNVPVFDMVQSTVLGSNQVKGGGKTSNAPRVLPIPQAFYIFLMKRRAFLERLVKEGTLIISDEIDSVDKLPFVCRGNNYLTRASTTDLSQAGRALFERIGIDKRTLAVLHQVLCSDDFKNLQLDEKEPTTYLFRRNFATHLYLLGLSLDEIQYLIGHDVEDPYVSRNSFADSDKLQDLWKRMELRPANKIFLNCEEGKLSNGCVENIATTYQIELMGDANKGTVYDIQADALEPAQPIAVAIESERVKFDAVIRMSTPPAEYPRTACILQEHQSAYRNRMINERGCRSDTHLVI